MQVRVYSPNIDLSRELQERVERRIGFAIDRVVEQVAWVGVKIGDVIGPKSGPDKRCQVHMSLRSGGSLFVEEMDVSLHRTIDLAAARARRVVDDHLKKDITIRRQSRARDMSMFDTSIGEVEVCHADGPGPSPNIARVPGGEKDKHPETSDKALLG